MDTEMVVRINDAIKELVSLFSQDEKEMDNSITKIEVLNEGDGYTVYLKVREILYPLDVHYYSICAIIPVDADTVYDGSF